MFIFILIAFLLTSRPVYATRITIEPESTTGTVGSGGVSLKVKLLQGESPDSGNSYKENAEIKIRSPRDGDKCDTIAGGSDVNGYIYGTCYATQTGTYAAYVHSDRGDDSPDVSLTFNAAPTQPEPTTTPDPAAPTDKAASKSASKKTSGQQLGQQQLGQQAGANKNPFIQDGLVPEEEKQDTGLAPQGEDGQVAGVVDTSQMDKAAPDLLKSLIFLTGALVLLIWSGYLIYLQVRGKSRKKKQVPEVHQTPQVPRQ